MKIEKVPHISPTKELEELILKEYQLVSEDSTCPYTYIKIIWRPVNFKKAITGVGYSKVSFPDVWNEFIGKSIALRRAVRNIRKQYQYLNILDQVSNED